MADFQQFLENLMHWGLEHFSRFYGQYRGNVVKNDDPEERHRIQCFVPAVGHKKAKYPEIWIEPAMTCAGGDRGMFFPPEVGDSVWVSFANGDAARPQVYWGGWFGAPAGKTEIPTEFAYASKFPQKRGFVSRMGHVLQFDDEAGEEAVRIVWHGPDPGDAALTDRSKSADRTKGDWATLSFESNGDVILSNKSGSMIYMDPNKKEVKIIDENGNSFVMGTKGIRAVDLGGNFVSIENGTVAVSAKKDFAVMAGSSMSVKTGGVNLAALAVKVTSPQVVLGSPAALPLVTHTKWLPQWAALASALTSLTASFATPSPVLTTMLLPLFAAMLPVAVSYPVTTTILTRAS